MIHALLSSLVVVLVFAALIAWVVGVLAFLRLFKTRVSGSLQYEDNRAEVQRLRKRALVSMAVFVVVVATGALVAVLRDYLGAS